MCRYEFIPSRSNYNKGAMTMEEVFEALKTVYKSEQATGTWSDLMPTKHEITMLTTTPIGAIIAKNNLLSYQSCLCYFREHSTQAKPTKHTVYLVKWLLDYAATSPDAILTYKKSGMVLAVHNDASYLNEPAAKSRVGKHFFCLSNVKDPLDNSAILNISKNFKAVMSSAAKAKLAALYINAHEAIPMQHLLEEMGHKQPPTPIQTDNSTANGAVENKIQPRCTKVMDR